jgi:hypothetical protein
MKHTTFRAMCCALALTGLLIPTVKAADEAAAAETTAAATTTAETTTAASSTDLTSALLRGLEQTLPTVQQKVETGEYAAAEEKLRQKEAEEAQIKAAQEEQARIQKEAEEKAAAERAAEEARKAEEEAKLPPQERLRSASGVYQGTAATNYETDGSYDGQTYTTDKDDENALRVTYARVSVSNSTISKTGGAAYSTSDMESYGLNSALLGSGNCGLNVSTSNITSTPANAPGVFSYGRSTFVRLTDSSVTTAGENSSALEVAANGKISAINVTAQTTGNSAPAINMGTGSGIISVEGGSYTTAGQNSPVVRSTGGVTMSKAALNAAQSDVIRVSGNNAVLLSEVTAESSGSPYAVLLTRSTDDNDNVGHAEFTMTGGHLTAHTGDMFYITNTKATVKLSKAEFTMDNPNANLMTIAANDGSQNWGEAGANGAEVELFLEEENAGGHITVDPYSQLNVILSNYSSFTGSINLVGNDAVAQKAADNKAAYDSAVAAAPADAELPTAPAEPVHRGTVDVVVGSGSTWTLTADSHISTLMCMGTIVYNGHTITLADGTVLSDTSAAAPAAQTEEQAQE